MPRHSEVRRLPYTPEQMFDLVADIASYPRFLPWVSAVRIRSNGASETVADLVVGFGGLKERFTSRVRKERPGRLTVDYVDGPLRFLRNDWTFALVPGGGCDIGFIVEFAFKLRIFEAVAGQVFDRALRRMIASFEERARVLYGVSAGISSSSAHSAA